MITCGMIKAGESRMHVDPDRNGLSEAELKPESKKSDDFVPPHDAIASRAYFLYLNGGSNQTHHWLLAEKQLILNIPRSSRVNATIGNDNCEHDCTPTSRFGKPTKKK